jgi:hypothetical protein
VNGYGTLGPVVDEPGGGASPFLLLSSGVGSDVAADAFAPFPCAPSASAFTSTSISAVDCVSRAS